MAKYYEGLSDLSQDLDFPVDDTQNVVACLTLLEQQIPFFELAS
jgi:hypothetical protein